MAKWGKHGFSHPCLRRATCRSPELWKHNWSLISRLWGLQYKHNQTDTNKTWKQKTSLCPSASLQAFQALVFRHHRHRREAWPNRKRRPAMTSPEKMGWLWYSLGSQQTLLQIKSLLFTVTFRFPSSLREISPSFLRRPWQVILPPKQKAK